MKFSILKVAVDQTTSEKIYKNTIVFFQSITREKYIALLVIKEVSGGSGIWKAPELTIS